MILLPVMACLAGPAPGRTVYVRAGAVFDGHELLDKKIIVVENGLITDVVGWDFAIPADGVIVDARHETVLPGFIDSHIRFTAPPEPYLARIEQHGPGRLAAEELSGYPKNRLDLLQHGVTTVVDLGTPVSVCAGMRNSMKKGGMLGPDIIFSGPLFTAPGGHPVSTIYTGRHDFIDGGTVQVADTGRARKNVDRLVKRGVDCIAIVYDRAEWFREGGVPRLDPAVADIVIEEAHRRGKKVFALVGTEAEARTMADMGVDGIDGGFSASSDSFLSGMGARGVFYTPAGGAAPIERPAASDRTRALGRAYRLGVPLCVGSGFPDSGADDPGEGLWREMKSWEDAGVPLFEILKSASSRAAARIGKAGEIGSVAPGFWANLVFVGGPIDPLTRASVSRVMVCGQIVIENGKPVGPAARRFRETSVQVLGYPYWDPLLSYLVGGSVSDCDLFHAGVSVQADVLFSFRNMWWLNVGFDLPSPIPKTGWSGDFHFDNQNRLFYGIGNDADLGDTTEYANLIFKEAVRTVTRLPKSWKLTVGLACDQTRVSSNRGISLPEITGTRGGNEMVGSLSIGHDTRDHETNPWSGHFIQAGIQAAPAVLPNSHCFGKFFFDARGYRTVGNRHILAGRLLVEQALGDAPFYYLPEIGGDTLGRGYLPFRFRDRNGLYGQFEYRFPVLSFMSGAVFADLGQVADSPADLTLAGFHPSVGFGPRFIFDRRETTLIGIDVGFTPEGWNLVLHTGHAF